MLGLGDRNLKIIREVLGVKVAAREGGVHVTGDRERVTAAREVLRQLADAAERETHLSRQQVLDLVGRAMTGIRSTGDGKPRSHRASADATDHEADLDRPWDDRLDVYAG